MRTRDLISAKAIALVETTPDSNAIEYLGRVFFPFDKKAGIDLKWIKTHKNLGVTLSPAAFDSKAALRSREGFNATVTQMAFFREAILLKESDEQEILRLVDANDPYAKDVAASIFDDAGTLVLGARTVPERMAWQLLAPTNGKPSISISGDGANYAYDYDPDNSFKTHNFVQMLGSSNWTDTEHSNPIADVMAARRLAKGRKPEVMVMNPNTFALLLVNKNVKANILAQNSTANYVMNDNDIFAIFKARANVDIIVYDKLFTDESGNDVYFYPDDMVTLLPNAPVGKTWFGTTPEERGSLTGANADFALIDNAFGVQVSTTVDPVNTKTLVSEIVLPSFEGMDSVVVLKVNTDLDTLSGTVAEGTASGTTKVTLAAAGTGYSYVYSTTTTSADGIYYGTDLSTWSAYTSGSDITIADGKKFAIARVNTDGLAASVGIFTADTKA